MINSLLFSCRYYFASSLALLFLCCKSNLSPQVEASTTNKSHYTYLSKEKGAAKIVKDEIDGFFDKIQDLDMCLQLGITEYENSELLKETYISHLKESVLEFTADEKQVLSETMDSCFNMIANKFPKLSLPTIELIKINANHYGPSVYYTRENAIIIPENELANATIGSLQAVMFHEISHILFRYSDELKTEAYSLIGFKKRSSEIDYPQELKNRMLLNPDGLDDRFYINLSKTDEEIMVIPVIISSKKKYSDNISGFMNYIKFDLYQLEIENNKLRVVCNENGFSTLGADYMGPFFDKIKENTQYIIHPDEIIADNFMMFLIGSRDGTLENFSEDGQKLLFDLEKILSN